jgi:peptide/nickel transport system ATP-binding protein/oligopeptide transport system ATP-binding protein
VTIALATVCRPEFIIADEPTTALDVVVQKEVLALIREVQREIDASLIFVTHDLAVHAHLTDRLGIMYAGRLVEEAPTRALFAAPRHPYSRALLSAIPVPNPHVRRERIILRGELPSAINPPPGCRFHTRCPFVIERCRTEPPPLMADGAGHAAACHRPGELPPFQPVRGSHISPSLQHLMAAFSGRPDVRPAAGVDMIEG